MQVKKLILIVMLFMWTGFLFAQENENKSKNSENEKKSYSSFYWLEKTSVYWSNPDGLEFLNLVSQLNYSLNIFKNNYFFSFNINDFMICDFVPLLINSDSYTDKKVMAGDMFHNSFKIGVENAFNIKRFTWLWLNLSAVLNSSFEGSNSISIDPLVKGEGDYFHGFSWLALTSFPIEFFLEEDYISFGPSFYVKAAFEFFRFYGPEKFRLEYQIDSSWDFSFPSAYYVNSIYQRSSTGLNFPLKKIEPFVYFVYSNYFYGPDYQAASRNIGFETGISLDFGNVSLSLDYEGNSDLLISTKNWKSRLELAFLLSL